MPLYYTPGVTIDGVDTNLDTSLPDLGTSSNRLGTVYSSGQDVDGNALVRGNIAQRNGLTPTEHILHATCTDDSNYERLRTYFDGTNWVIAGESAGTGVTRELVIDAPRLTVKSNGGTEPSRLQLGNYNAAIVDGDELGRLEFFNGDFSGEAAVAAFIAGCTSSTDERVGEIVFHTGIISNPPERMRLSYVGDLLLADRGIGLYGKTPPATQPPHIPDADGTLADLTSKFNTLLANVVEAYGMTAAA